MVRAAIDQLKETQKTDRSTLKSLILLTDQEERDYLYSTARQVREQYYGKKVFVRGLIEFTNYCRNDCYYCGIRKSNAQASRYRLSKDEIMDCCEIGYQLGFRTFVLQGGEDGHYTIEMLGDIISSIHRKFPDCAITISFGEWSREAYEHWFQCGAERYLLRHETANEEHYRSLHPEQMSLSNRKQCLYNLREIGYQVGSGFMVGSPGQTVDCLIEDIEFLQDLKPHMIGIGPYISHKDTPFCNEKNGTLEQTLNLLALLRIIFPKVLLPATTSLGTIDPGGREFGLLAGANVVMPNLSPVSVRKKYMLYDNKICTGEESAQCQKCLKRRIESTGYEMVVERGDSLVELS